MTIFLTTILSWSRGLASLSPGVVPCRGLRDEEWRETHRRCTEFVERWGMQAYGYANRFLAAEIRLAGDAFEAVNRNIGKAGDFPQNQW